MSTQLLFKAWIADDCGTTAVEYTIVSGCMALALVTILPIITNGTDGIYGFVAGYFDY